MIRVSTKNLVFKILTILTFLAKNPDFFSISTKGKYFGGPLRAHQVS